MKKLIFTFIAIISINCFSQNPELFDTTWYLHYLEIDGEEIYPPSNSEIENVFLIFDNPTTLEFMACQFGSGTIINIDNSAYTVENYTFLPFAECEMPDTIAFETLYFVTFLKTVVANNEYQYEVITNPDTMALIITNGEGHKGYYGDAVLATPENASSTFTLYPNPVNDALNISLTNADFENVSYRILNITGKQVKVATINTSTSFAINVEDLKTGVYFLKIKTKEGLLLTKRFVKK